MLPGGEQDCGADWLPCEQGCGKLKTRFGTGLSDLSSGLEHVVWEGQGEETRGRGAVCAEGACMQSASAVSGCMFTLASASCPSSLEPSALPTHRLFSMSSSCLCCTTSSSTTQCWATTTCTTQHSACCRWWSPHPQAAGSCASSRCMACGSHPAGRVRWTAWWTSFA